MNKKIKYERQNFKIFRRKYRKKTLQKMKTIKKTMHKFNYIKMNDFCSMKRPHKQE